MSYSINTREDLTEEVMKNMFQAMKAAEDRDLEKIRNLRHELEALTSRLENIRTTTVEASR